MIKHLIFLIFACLVNVSLALASSPGATASDNPRRPNSRDGYGLTDFMKLTHQNPKEVNRALRLKRAFGLYGGADLYARDDQGRTALFFATAETDDPRETLLTLLELGFSPHSRDKWGSTVLMRGAVYYGNIEAIKILLRKGADPLAVNNYGESAMHFARDIKTVKFLQGEGLSINHQDFQGKSLLHLWATNPEREEKSILKLIELGADKELQDNRGYKPFDAPESYHTENEPESHSTKDKKPQKKKKAVEELVLFHRIPDFVSVSYVYVGLNRIINRVMGKTGHFFEDFTDVVDVCNDLPKAIKEAKLSRNAPGIAVDVYRITLLKTMYLKAEASLKNALFHEDPAQFERTKRLWGSIHGLVTGFRSGITHNVCPVEENIDNLAVQNLRNLIVNPDYLNSSFEDRVSAYGTTVTRVERIAEPEDLAFYSKLADTSACILSTGGAWGIDHNRVAKGVELKVMMESAENIGINLARIYLSRLRPGAASSTCEEGKLEETLVVRSPMGGLSDVEAPFNGEEYFKGLESPKKQRHKLEILQSLAQKLYTPEDTTNPYADNLTHHQTAVFFLASRAAIQRLDADAKKVWDDIDMQFTTSVANQHLKATGRTLTVDRAYMDNLLGRIYDRLGA